MITPKLFTAGLRIYKAGLGEVNRYERLENDITKFSESEEDLERAVQKMHSESLVVRLEVDMKSQRNFCTAKADEYTNFLGKLSMLMKTTRKNLGVQLVWSGSAFRKHSNNER